MPEAASRFGTEKKIVMLPIETDKALGCPHLQFHQVDQVRAAQNSWAERLEADDRQSAQFSMALFEFNRASIIS
jgi:hypothetical protein